jgi:hypothetical protein
MNKLSKLLDIEDRKAILNFILCISFFGILINFSLYSIFGIKFGYFSWLAWGIFMWIIEKRIVPVIRNIFIR